MERHASQISLDRTAPFGGLDTDPLRMPHSLIVPKPDAPSVYGPAPIADVPLEDTVLSDVLKRHAEGNGLAVWRFFAHWNLQLRPKVREALKARTDAFDRLLAQQKRSEASNEPIAPRLEACEENFDALTSERLSQSKEHARKRAEVVVEAAVAHARCKLRFDPTSPVPVIPQPETLRSVEAVAAAEKLPWNTKETGFFLHPAIEIILSVIAGSVTGISQMCAAHILHPSALGHDPVGVIIFAAVFGIAMTILAGFGVKLLWRMASESYYFGNLWFGPAAVALLATIALIAIETVVDMRGLLASASIHANVQALNGKTPQSDGNGPVTMLLVGAFASISYFIYSAIRGWMKDRSAAFNRVRLAQESERLAKLDEIRSDPAYVDVLSAGNRIVALDAIEADLAQAYERTKAVVIARQSDLRTQLQPIPERPSADDAALLEKAIQEAEGQQTESNRMFQALQENRIYNSSPRDVKPSNKPGLLSRIKSLFAGFRKKGGK